MNCQQFRRLWNLYFDSEGDAQNHFQMNEHLRHCTGCRTWFDGQNRLESRIQAAVSDKQCELDATVDWQRVLEGVKDPPRERGAGSKWRTWGTLLIASSAIALIAIMWGWSSSNRAAPNTARLLEQAVVVHRQISGGGLHPDFESPSDLAVDQYLVRRVSFPVRCPPRKDSGFIVRGAGQCELDSNTVAYVVGKVDEESITIFVLPKEAAGHLADSDRPVQNREIFTQVEGYRIAHSIIDRNLVLVVGNVDNTKLRRVLRSYGTYPHTS